MDVREQVKDLMRKWIEDRCRRMALFITCQCGQEIMISNRESLFQWLAEDRHAAVVDADERVTCPTCGAAFHEELDAAKERSVSIALEGIDKASDDDVGEMLGPLQEQWDAILEARALHN